MTICRGQALIRALLRQAPPGFRQQDQDLYPNWLAIRAGLAAVPDAAIAPASYPCVGLPPTSLHALS
ncbi:hypothetical protein GCM10010971_09300 [Silvimonas amylolytica]|uniref:Uncharacterized protein n=1 Tax=Silvimonas amylolytica TaxID=449663 RepID=A0ABQ2PIF1_9NEIS|nr:hypothetical protein GCM10010971_09300 [Silvimonas amylolytica]